MSVPDLPLQIPVPRPRVLAIGYACFDLALSVPYHPGPDEKVGATAFASCGGGLSANAAAAAGALGYDTTLAAYLGRDPFGDAHVRELEDLGVRTDLLLRGESPTPVSGIMVKPDGRRALAAFRGDRPQYAENALNLAALETQAVQVDGHQLALSTQVLRQARGLGIPSLMDADSDSDRSRALAREVDHLVAAERFAYSYADTRDPDAALRGIAHLAPTVVVTLGEKGLIWAKEGAFGALPAYKVEAVDTNGAGDAFHGAYLGGLAEAMAWPDLLRFASATAGLCCQTAGGRNGLPTRGEVIQLMSSQPLPDLPWPKE